ncbi:tRNA lysidine(34) synthetase TilS [Candidatus Marinamargulisbacteria bacterium SCGC AG-333-B06]|nr:tRNA lysidine(34) synthetase TilS [Candidatus Marinamargulisbacteria bacterium SCGC AG-333-B06]
MGAFKHQLQEMIVTESLFSRDDHLIISFSGGSDSVALVHALVSLGYKNLKLIYFDHGLRSQQERDVERDFVACFAADYNLSFRILSLPITFVANHYDHSLESAGHVLRYECLQRLAGIADIKTVVLAHHKNDVLETLLLQLDRGSVFHMGLPVQQVVGDTTFVRPMLRHDKQAILAYCNDNTVSYCTDSSNQDMSFRRNQIRHSVVPVLTTFSSSFDEHLHVLFQRVQASYDINVVKQLLSSCRVIEYEYYFECVFSAAVTQSEFYLSSAIYHMLKQCFNAGLGKRLRDRLLANFDCNRTQLECLKQAIINHKSGEIVHLKKGVVVHCYHQTLYLVKQFPKSVSDVSLNVNSSIEWGGYRITLERCDFIPDSLVSSKRHCYVSLPSDSITVSMLARQDSFFPFQSIVPVRVKKRLAKQGVQAFFQQFCLVFKHKGEIAWVPELGVDNRYLVDREGEWCYKIVCDIAFI